jgi:hypothetical protein
MAIVKRPQKLIRHYFFDSERLFQAEVADFMRAGFLYGFTTVENESKDKRPPGGGVAKTMIELFHIWKQSTQGSIIIQACSYGEKRLRMRHAAWHRDLKANPDSSLQTDAAEIDNRLAGCPVGTFGRRALDHDQSGRSNQYRDGFIIEFSLLKQLAELIVELTRPL